MPVISHSYLLCACENTSVLLWADLSDRTVSRVTHEVPRPPSRSREPVPLTALPFPQAPGLVSALRFRDSDFSCPGSAGATASGPWVSPSDALAGQGGRGAPARCRERQASAFLTPEPRSPCISPHPLAARRTPGRSHALAVANAAAVGTEGRVSPPDPLWTHPEKRTCRVTW